jgi:poly(A) polymerase
MLDKLTQEHRRGFRLLDELFRENGFRIRLAGGAVRDLLLDKTPSDLDFATTAMPDEMMALASDEIAVVPTGIEHGTVTFVTEFGEFEVTTLRVDVECDGRHAEVEFTTSWEADAARRDFTINAMMMNIHGNVFDFHGGKEDLEAGIMRFVGDANERIEEDALRILRFFRITHKTGCELLSPVALMACAKHVDMLAGVSVERVWDEFKKVCKDSPDKVGNFLLSLAAIEAHKVLDLPLEDPMVISNITDHVSKFPTFVIGTQLTTVDIALQFADHWKLSNAERAELVFFVTNKDKEHTPQDIQDFIMDGVDKEWLEAVVDFQQDEDLHDYIHVVEFFPFPVTGKDLMQVGFEQGILLGQQLEKLRKEWKDSRYTLTKEQLLAKFTI